MKKNNQSIMSNIKNRPSGLIVLGILTVFLFLLSVSVILFALLVNWETGKPFSYTLIFNELETKWN